MPDRVDELKQLIYHSGSLLLVGSTQVALVDLPKWYAVSAAPFSAAYRCLQKPNGSLL